MIVDCISNLISSGTNKNDKHNTLYTGGGAALAALLPLMCVRMTDRKSVMHGMIEFEFFILFGWESQTIP